MSEKKNISEVVFADAASIPTLQTLRKAAPIRAIQLMQSQQTQASVSNSQQIQPPTTAQQEKSK